MRMTSLIAAAGLALVLAGGPAAAQEMTAQSFIKQAQEGNQAEVRLGELAQKQAKSDEVKQYGQRMVQDHGKARDQLNQVAEQKNVQIDEKLSQKHQETAQRMEQLQGAEFDRAYMKYMVEDHQKAVDMYQQAAKAIDDQQVKDYIQQTLPTLQQHLQTAQKLYQPEAAAGDATPAPTGATR